MSRDCCVCGTNLVSNSLKQGIHDTYPDFLVLELWFSLPVNQARMTMYAVRFWNVADFVHSDNSIAHFRSTFDSNCLLKCYAVLDFWILILKFISIWLASWFIFLPCFYKHEFCYFNIQYGRTTFVVKNSDLISFYTKLEREMYWCCSTVWWGGDTKFSAFCFPYSWSGFRKIYLLIMYLWFRQVVHAASSLHLY